MKNRKHKNRGPSQDQAYKQADSASLFLDREGDENEYDPRFLQKISDYYKKMHLIEEQSLPLPRDVYGGIEKALLSSKFYLEDNEYADMHNSRFMGAVEQTDAAEAFGDALDQFFKSIELPVEVNVISVDEAGLKGNTSKLQNNTRPNRFVVGAQMALDEQGGGVLLLFAVTANENFDKSLIDPTKMVQDASTTIRHELMHDRQYSTISKDMRVTRSEAKKQLEDWGLIPPDDAPRKDYLGSHIEIDAFGHEFAERLAQVFGIEKSEELVSTQDVSKMQKVAASVSLSDNFKEYYEEYPDEKFTERLQKKIRKNLKQFKQERIYEERILEGVLEKMTCHNDF